MKDLKFGDKALITLPGFYEGRIGVLTGMDHFGLQGMKYEILLILGTITKTVYIDQDYVIKAPESETKTFKAV